MFRTVVFAFLLVAFPLFTGTAHALMTLHPLESPNKDFKVVIAVGPISQTSAAVFHKGELKLTLNSLGLLLDSGEPIPTPLVSREYTEAMLAKREQMPPSRYQGLRDPFGNLGGGNHDGAAPYNETHVEYIGFMKIVFRAYDTGIAFRYEFTPKAEETLTIEKELTSFRFSDDYFCKSAQQDSERVPLSRLIAAVESPLTVEMSNDVSLVVGETPPGDFAPMKLRFGTKSESSFNNLYDREGAINRTGKPTSVVVVLDRAVIIQGADRSPWRYVGLSGNETEMLKSLGR